MGFYRGGHGVFLQFFCEPPASPQAPPTCPPPKTPKTHHLQKGGFFPRKVLSPNQKKNELEI